MLRLRLERYVVIYKLSEVGIERRNRRICNVVSVRFAHRHTERNQRGPGLRRLRQQRFSDLQFRQEEIETTAIRRDCERKRQIDFAIEPAHAGGSPVESFERRNYAM